MHDGGVRVRRNQLNVSSEKLLAEVQDDIDRFHTKIIKDHLVTKKLGYTEWLVILALLGALYGYVVYQDHQVPPVIRGNQHGNFSEERARVILNQIASLGPRVSGSDACEKKAFKIITSKLYELQTVATGKGVNRIEVDIDRPTGCYDLKFLSSFTLCYHKITNIVGRIGPKTGPTNNAILLNCHFDTLPDTPGATDDAVSCAIMMEVLENLAYSNEPLKNDIVLLFNGAEENFLQASHGFITQHKWRHQIRAFINLEGTGSGGREILFQAGPGDSWLLKTYLDHAPYPHCSVLAQEVFQSGIIPSDTDFRVFRDYGRVSGLDIAYHRNGWVYHTEFDTADQINEGAIQRAGENILAVVKALIKSPYIEQPAHFNEGNKWVFYDVVGLFTVFYEVSSGFFVNLFVVGLVVALVIYRISAKAYTFTDLLVAFLHHFQALIAMAGTGIILVIIVKVLDLIMSWYAMPELVFPLYILPMIIAGLWVHSHVAETKYVGIDKEMVHYDSVLLIWASILFITTLMGLASSFFFLIHVLFPILRDPIIYLLGKLQIIEVVTPRKVLYVQFACLIPVMLFVSYAVMLFFDFFVPVMGRLGNLVNPEFVMMPLSLTTALTFVLFTNNLIYISRNMKYLLRCGVAVSVLFLIVLATTSLGVPYKYSPESPRLRRLVILHSERNVYDFSGKKIKNDHALFIQSFDFRGIADLPDHAFLQTHQRPNCSGIPDEYCRLPYYTAIHELFPPEESLWVPVPVPPVLPQRLDLALVERRKISSNQVNLTFSIRGGTDKVSLHVTPINGYKLKNWSFKEFDEETFGPRNTYFVFMSYGFEAPKSRDFWILLETNNPAPTNPEENPSLELAVATHYAHGSHQNSETLTQLRQMIQSRRKVPHHAIGYWKWASTIIGGASEIIVHQF
jgi:hypothetical protein